MAKRTVRRPTRRASQAAVPSVFSDLTARDWKSLRAHEARLKSEYNDDPDGESPMESVMTSKGYVDVGHDAEGGYVMARGFNLHKDFWPRPRKAARRVRRRTSR